MVGIIQKTLIAAVLLAVGLSWLFQLFPNACGLPLCELARDTSTALHAIVEWTVITTIWMVALYVFRK
jgi:hypothetical protein